MARCGWMVASAFALVACGSGSGTSPGPSGADGGDGGGPADAQVDAPTGSDAADAAADAGADAPPHSCPSSGPCVLVDLSHPGRTIPPELFGDQLGWLDDGQGIWDPDAGAVRTSLVQALQPFGLTVMRYPGGTLSDFFHWQGAVGPVAMRTPQENPFAPQPGNTQIPLFGPDEFAQVAQTLGSEILITANVGTGTPSEAAGWLSYYTSKGIKTRYWEIGNEVYLAGNTWSAQQQRKTPQEYATLFDAYASALRAIDPTVQVGMVGCHDSGTFPLCAVSNWNAIVLSSVTQPVDFMAVHNSYAPAAPYDADTPKALRATLASPDYVAANFQLVEADIAQYAHPESAQLRLAVTEHASFFVPSGASTDVAWLTLNRSLASALFSAVEYDVFLAEPRLALTNHINPFSPFWQAHLTTSSTDGFSLPTESAFGEVFRLYADMGGGTYISPQVQGSPTFDSVAFGIVPTLTGVPMLHAAAALSSSRDRLWIYVVNRDLTTDVTAEVVIPTFPPVGVSSVTAEVLNGSDPTAANVPGQTPVVQVSTSTLAAASSFAHTFPAHSLTRFTIR